MTSPKHVLKAIGPKLVPFFKTVSIYFVVFLPDNQPSLLALGLKCLPVLSLIAFVLLHGMSLGEEYAYSRRILFGLIFSVIGDAFLIYEDKFLHGLSSFFIAQICYISAFGFYPINFYVMTVCTGFLVGALAVILPHTTGIISFAIAMYSLVVMTMVWRAVARVQLFDDLWTWTKLCSCVGGILFAISDTCLSFNAFAMPVPYSQVIIMSTYYAAQFGISLSVVDSKASFFDAQKSKNQNIAVSKSLINGSFKNDQITTSGDLQSSDDEILKENNVSAPAFTEIRTRSKTRFDVAGSTWSH